MLKELFESISTQAARAAGHHKTATFVDHPDETKSLMLFGDKCEVVDVPPKERRHRVETLDDLVRAVTTYIQAVASIWHSDEKIIAIVDDDAIRNRVYMPLTFSDQFRALQKGSLIFDQVGIVRFLRVVMDGAGAETLVPTFRKITFKRGSQTKGNLNHGDESMGREIESLVENSKEIPETITLHVPVYDSYGLNNRRAIRLAVEIDANQERFTLTVLADELKTAIQLQQVQIHEWLTDSAGDTTSVFWGDPQICNEK